MGEFLKNNLDIFSFGVGILGILFAVFTWMNGKRKKEFTYAKTTFQLVSEGVSSVNRLKLLFDEKPIPDLTVTRFTIWNSGTEEIKREDLYSNQPLCIKDTENVHILNASIIEQSNADKFTLSVNNSNDVMVNFECAEKNDGVVIQIVHSGNSDALKPVIGIKGGKEVRSYETGTSNTSYIIACIILSLLVSLFPSIFVVKFLIFLFDSEALLLIVWIFIYVLLYITLLYFGEKKHILCNLPIPPKLRKYVEVEITS